MRRTDPERSHMLSMMLQPTASKLRTRETSCLRSNGFTKNESDWYHNLMDSADSFTLLDVLHPVHLLQQVSQESHLLQRVLLKGQRVRK